MKKHLIIIALFFCCISFVSAREKGMKPKLSAFTQQYISQRNKTANPGMPDPRYVYKRINDKMYLSSFIKVTSAVDEARIHALGAYIGTKAGNIWTVQIPVERFNEFIAVTGISYIDLDAPIFPVLDSARKQTRADSAQSGINLPMPMTGKDVVVGVIDAGFDFTHPTMFDTLYSQYRIKRLWAQKLAGTPPAGYAYGSELTDTNAIKSLGYDTAILSHGTHVTGIAAGSGYGSGTNNSRFRGMAFESDIVLVGIMPLPGQWAVAGESDIIDGMNYIYNYANSVGKPAVVNLSWGSSIGPHDGNSLFSQACDALTGAGKIFVCAAGNNGEDTIHLEKNFSATDTSVSTFVTFSPYLDTDNQKTWVDIWGDTGNTFCLNFRLFNGNNITDSTATLCLADTVHTYNLVGSNGDTCFITVSMTSTEYNGKPHALLYFYSRTHDNICLTATSSNARVNMWEGYVLPPEGYYGYLKKLGYPWATSGDVNMTVSDIGCTRSAITTAAYTSKTSFKNINGTTLYYPGATHGKIAPFSSLGPTVDSRIKPDISSPGFALASSVSSYDTSYNTTGTNYSSVISNSVQGGRTYSYAMLAGTSMASPCTSGIVALMLQLNPLLTPDSVKDILAATAIKDSYTGNLPATGNTVWGHGKINAYSALKLMAQNLSVVNSAGIDPLNCLLFPNPNRGTFTIRYKSMIPEMITVTFSDITGKIINKQYWAVTTGYNNKEFSVSTLSKGVYFAEISSSAGHIAVRMVIN